MGLATTRKKKKTNAVLPKGRATTLQTHKISIKQTKLKLVVISPNSLDGVSTGCDKPQVDCDKPQLVVIATTRGREGGRGEVNLSP